MSDILEEIQALQEQFSNLLDEELEKEGPKGEIKDLSRPPKKDYFDKKIEAAKANFRTADKVARNNWKKFQASDDTDSSGYSDSYADARTADNEREKALDNYEYTKKEMDAARKGKRIEPKSTMEQIRRIRARRENAIKMNDNNSYNEIVSQIMDLKEAFSNLFEVDDLGQPAMDVPPSQNKIKRDRKTKDGKVELVSVEDELFPYEGNKREQYRQKILDTINNMIQGKATLEDLLQIVRQKKAPLKEAMELMEDIRSAIEKKHGKPEYYSGRSPWQVGKEPANKSAELTQKANEIKEKEALQAAERELDKDRPDLKDAHPAKKNYKVADYYGQIMARRNGKAPLKEAIELMEELLLERNKENRDKKEKWELKTNNITKKYKKAIQDYAKQEGDEAKFHRAAAADYDHIYSQQPAKAPDGSPNSVAAYFNDKYQEMLRNKGRNEQNIADEVEPLTKKLKNRKHSFHDRVRGWTESEALEEAMKVLEELIGEGRNLEDVVVRGYNKGKVSLDDLQKLMDKAHEVPSDSSYFHKSKGEKGELRTKHRHMDYERNVLSDGWGKDDNKKIEASIKRKAKNDKSFPVFQALKAYKEGKANVKEALEIMEAIINEVSVKKWKEAAKNSIEGRKEAASDASDRFGEVVYPFRGEVNDPGHKLGNAWDKAEQRADRAEQLAKNLPDSNKSATKLKQAAKKVVDKRDKDNEEAVDKLQGAVDKLKEKPYDERTDKDYSDLAKVQNEWVGKQKKENQARNLVGKPERRPEKNSEGKHKLKEQGFIDRSNEA